MLINLFSDNTLFIKINETEYFGQNSTNDSQQWKKCLDTEDIKNNGVDFSFQ